MMDLEDQLLATNRTSCWCVDELGRSVGENNRERRQLEYDARSILTTWGDRHASESGLHDYGNRDWSGLTHDSIDALASVLHESRKFDGVWASTQARRLVRNGRRMESSGATVSGKFVGNPHALAQRIGKELEISMSARWSHGRSLA